ncbi:hypothetical protein Dimus_031883 [Dionaea muscipula]
MHNQRRRKRGGNPRSPAKHTTSEAAAAKKVAQIANHHHRRTVDRVASASIFIIGENDLRKSILIGPSTENNGEPKSKNQKLSLLIKIKKSNVAKYGEEEREIPAAAREQVRDDQPSKILNSKWVSHS